MTCRCAPLQDATKPKERSVLLVSDPTLQEEAAMDGKIMFSINAHRYSGGCMHWLMAAVLTYLLCAESCAP